MIQGPDGFHAVAVIGDAWSLHGWLIGIVPPVRVAKMFLGCGFLRFPLEDGMKSSQRCLRGQFPGLSKLGRWLRRCFGPRVQVERPRWGLRFYVPLAIDGGGIFSHQGLAWMRMPLISGADVILKMATAFYAHACVGSAQDRLAAKRIFMALEFAIPAAVVAGAISPAGAQELRIVVRHSTQQRMLLDDDWQPT